MLTRTAGRLRSRTTRPPALLFDCLLLRIILCILLSCLNLRFFFPVFPAHNRGITDTRAFLLTRRKAMRYIQPTMNPS